MPDLVKISIIFVVMLLLLRRKPGVGPVMLVGSALLCLLYGMGAQDVIRAVKNASFNAVTIKLFLSLSLIKVLELVLREQQVLAGMMKAVKGFFRSRRAVIVSMPILIGVLPSLGGAFFSAPMVEEATSGLGMSPEEKAYINYWYRHPWEYILPLYPGILLASAVSGIPLYTLIGANMIYAVTLLAGGFLYSMRGIDAAAPPLSGNAGVRSFLSFLPVLVVLTMVLAGHIELHYALFLAIILLFFLYRYRPADLGRVIKYGVSADVIILIFGIMFFKEIMDVSGAVKNVSSFFVKEGIPVLPVVCLLPFFAGLLTGHTVGFVGSTFPLLIGMAGGAPVALISLAFAAGFIGVLLSPVHVCFVLSRQYFNADLWGMYRRLIPASALIIVVAFLEYLILR